MKTVLQTLILVLITLSLSSQNYFSIKANAISYFTYSSSTGILPIRIDSTISRGDSTDYYSFYVFTKSSISPYHYFTNKTSWIGKKLIDCGNGTNIFIKENNDSIFIKTNALLNESWKMYKYANGNFILATISNTYNDTITLGLTDSVKVISLQLKSSDSSNLSSPLNSKTFVLSKNYGFFVLTFINNFPENNGTPQKLIGLTNPVVGWQNIQLKDFYSMQPGSEIHYKTTNDDICQSQNSYFVYVIIKYLACELDTINNKIKFTCERCGLKVMNYDSTHYHDTVSFNVSLSGNINHLPLEIFYSGNSPKWISKTINSASEESNYNYTAIGNGEYVINPYGTGGNRNTYYVSLGSLYYDSYQCGGGSVPWIASSYSNFIYYNVNGVEWGTPYECKKLLNIQDNKINLSNDFKLYPNPSNNYFIIELNTVNQQSFKLKTTNLQGQIIKSKVLFEQINNIDVSDLQNGIYIIEITNNENTYYNKLIINK